MPVAYFTFPPLADLSVTAAGPRDAGDDRLGVQLFGERRRIADRIPASNVVLSIPAQAGLRFSAIAAPAGWTCATPAPGTTGAVSCTAASLAVGGVDDHRGHRAG